MCSFYTRNSAWTVRKMSVDHRDSFVELYKVREEQNISMRCLLDPVRSSTAINRRCVRRGKCNPTCDSSDIVKKLMEKAVGIPRHLMSLLFAELFSHFLISPSQR